MIEELLQFFVGVIDAQLLETVEIKDLKASNIQNANEASTLSFGSVQRPVDPGDNPFEEPFVGGLWKCFDGKFHLLLGLSFGDKVTAHLDSGLQEASGQLVDVDAEEMGHFLSHCVIGQDGLVGVAFLLELHVAEKKGATDDAPDGGDFFFVEAHDSHGLHGGQEFFAIILAAHGNETTGKECIVFGVLEDVFLCWRSNISDELDPNCLKLRLIAARVMSIEDKRPFGLFSSNPDHDTWSL